MNHPTREEWMSYLYDELPSSATVALRQHVETCSTCQKNVAEWQSARRNLDSWKAPKKSPALPFVQSAWKWGIAALFALGFGYGLGRFSVPAANVETLRAGIENSLRTSLAKEVQARIQPRLTTEVKAMWANAQAQLIDRTDALAAKTLTASAEQTQGILSAYDDSLKAMNTRVTRLNSELSTLRTDTETMAVLAEYGFRRNEQQWIQLATDNDSPGRLTVRPNTRDNP